MKTPFSKSKSSRKRYTKPSKLRRAARWLKPNTKLKGMMLFVLVFGALGGAYYLHQSHAQSVVLMYNFYARDNATNQCPAGITNATGAANEARAVYNKAGLALSVAGVAACGGHTQAWY